VEGFERVVIKNLFNFCIFQKHLRGINSNFLEPLTEIILQQKSLKNYQATQKKISFLIQKLINYLNGFDIKGEKYNPG
jgi:hypothetical protein